MTLPPWVDEDDLLRLCIRLSTRLFVLVHTHLYNVHLCGPRVDIVSGMCRRRTRPGGFRLSLLWGCQHWRHTKLVRCLSPVWCWQRYAVMDFSIVLTSVHDSRCCVDWHWRLMSVSSSCQILLYNNTILSIGDTTTVSCRLQTAQVQDYICGKGCNSTNCQKIVKPRRPVKVSK